MFFLEKWPLITGFGILAGFAASSGPVLAQQTGPTVTLPAPSSASPPELPRQKLEALAERDQGCIMPATVSHGGVGPIGCAFGNTSLGMDYSFRQAAEGHEIQFRAIAAREAEGALSLDRMMFGQHRGMAEEALLTGFTANASLFDGRVKFDSTFAWSRRWLAQQEQSPVFLHRQGRGNDAAQSFKLTVVPIERDGYRWSVTADHARAGDEYLAGRLSMQLPVAAFAGSRSSVSSSLSAGKWRLNASIARQNSLFSRSDTAKVKIARGGLGVNFAAQSSTAAPTANYPTLPQVRSAKTTVGMEFDLAGISPGLAADSTVPAILIPRYSTIAYEQRTTSLIESGTRYQRRSMDFTAMWDSRFGDTYLNYRTDRKRPIDGASRPGDDAMLHLSHSLQRGNWNIGVDMTRTTSRSGAGAAESSASLSWGGTVRYAPKQGPELRLRVGRDNSVYEFGAGSIASRDSGLQVHAALDMTQWLRRRLRRDDVHLTAEYRHRMRRSDYDYELFEGVIESDRDRLSRHGFLISFAMKLG